MRKTDLKYKKCLKTKQKMQDSTDGANGCSPPHPVDSTGQRIFWRPAYCDKPALYTDRTIVLSE